MKTKQEIKDRIAELKTELKKIQKSKKTPMMKSVDYQALSKREREINTEASIIGKYLSFPILSQVEFEKQIELKSVAFDKLEIQKKKYDPDGFSNLLEQINRIKVEVETLRWLVT